MNLNETIFIWINQVATHEWLDQFFPWFTDLHKNTYFKFIIPLLLIGFLFKKFEIRFWIPLLQITLAVSLSDFTGSIVKNTFNQPRPFQIADLNTIKKSPASENKSFYSNHASNNFAAANTLASFFPSLKIIFYSVAGIVGYSRVYNGVHFPIDILCGALAGLFISLAIGQLFLLLGKKYEMFNYRR